ICDALITADLTAAPRFASEAFAVNEECRDIFLRQSLSLSAASKATLPDEYWALLNQRRMALAQPESASDSTTAVVRARLREIEADALGKDAQGRSIPIERTTPQE